MNKECQIKTTQQVLEMLGLGSLSNIISVDLRLDSENLPTVKIVTYAAGDQNILKRKIIYREIADVHILPETWRPEDSSNQTNTDDWK